MMLVPLDGKKDLISGLAVMQTMVLVIELLLMPTMFIYPQFITKPLHLVHG